MGKCALYELCEFNAVFCEKGNFGYDGGLCGVFGELGGFGFGELYKHIIIDMIVASVCVIAASFCDGFNKRFEFCGCE